MMRPGAARFDRRFRAGECESIAVFAPFSRAGRAKAEQRIDISISSQNESRRPAAIARVSVKRLICLQFL
jgi:hypothetical protein